ncbi:uncharacterized protein A4U43_C02F5870 [Asparagus officinalis]|uniref:C3H1-type domain-containing protein n=1 Tax=Asparagus officinalis TaxID=4686 RepID=A0A5P1FG69_ASPOF|nr:uncharacterized protein A4U43_C02F5870 [Asparagus officinalis]
MADPVTADEQPKPTVNETLGGLQSRKEKRKALKKLKRKQIRKEAAIREREEEEARSNDPEEEERIRKAEEEERRRQKLLEESERRKGEHSNELDEDDEWDYIEDGPAEIIWKGNEIIVKKKMAKIPKGSADRKQDDKDVERPTSNPLPPQSVAYASYNNRQHTSAPDLLESVAQQVPNFGTEQDKAHCPFHLKTGACRFGTRCSRVHFYPDKSCTILIKNMYNGPGLAWEQDEGLEHTNEEIEHCYEEFYEDVHTEFLKFGELVNFKVCRNGSSHLRGNVYVHYRFLESAVLAYNTMNARYFAGKQITCEFVGVTRWKVAICGEFMKSRLRNCSRGSACNFIHCFRNPGGDYEWADWDNPPPKYWIRKMGVLFGNSDELSYGKQMEFGDFESPRDSSRKRAPITGRYHSRRSPGDEIEVHDYGSDRENSYRKRDRSSSRSVRREHSERRKDESKQHEENHKSKVHHYDTKNSPHAANVDRYREKDREYDKKHQKFESHQRQKGEDSSVRKEKSERKHRSKSNKREREEDISSHQLSVYNDDRRNRSSSHSSGEYLRHSIDVQDQDDARYCSNDSDSERNFSDQDRPHRNKQHKSRHRRHTTNYDEKAKLMKYEAYDDRWETRGEASGREETEESSYNGSSSSHRKPSKSGGKLKHCRKKRRHVDNSSGSDEELDRKPRKKHSHGQRTSAEKRSQQRSHNS